MTQNKKWKDRILSSGIPLEHEAGKILAQNDFMVDADYSYQRRDELDAKEFSVDLMASKHFDLYEKYDIKNECTLFIECKYRNPSKHWFFIPDYNHHDFALFSKKGANKVLDEFSTFKVPHGNTFNETPTALKGIEVNVTNGDTHEADINRGLKQLLYSIPFHLKQSISKSLYISRRDKIPSFICPILLTTAKLFIFDVNSGISFVKNSEEINDLGIEVPFLKMYSDTPPTFVTHCANIFSGKLSEEQQRMFTALYNLRKNYRNKDDKSSCSCPDELFSRLFQGTELDFFSETIICNFDHFQELLNAIELDVVSRSKSMISVEIEDQN